MHNSLHCPICKGLPAGGSMTDDAFNAFLQACRKELTDKQSSFIERIRDAQPWSYDLSEGSLTIGGFRYSVTPIGSHNNERQTWLWAWANEEMSPRARKSAEVFRELFDKTGFRVFADPGIGASSGDAQDFAAMAMHHIGAFGLFRSHTDGPTLFLAVLDTQT